MIKLEDLVRLGSNEQGSTLDRPLDHLLACHRRIEERLDTLWRVIPHLNAKRGEAMAAISAALHFFDTNGVWHTADEEESLFPRLAGRLTNEETALLQSLDSDHRRAESLHLELAQVVASMAAEDPISNDLQDQYALLVADLVSLYRRHIDTEDTQLQAIGSRLGSDALAEIAREMKARRGLAPGN